ncbi:MAG: AMP-binding protein, partial [Bacteroidales bacterium]|nr:AMP-binding protein [Bacteroidales bacterium]
ASLYIPEKLIKDDARLFENYLISNKITVAALPPVYAENLNEESFKGFRLLVTAGSETNSNLVERFNKYTRYVNSYGPTETTISATYWETSEYEKTGKISIGKPIRNLEAYILNSHNHLQGIGIPGELCISGDGLARGYLHLPVITLEKFIKHPFKEGERLYRTGDLASWLPDGNIEFLGRIDHQVKIRGFRIELGEIESTLLKHKNIKESIVLAIEKNNDKYLCAYVVCKEEFSHEDLRAYMLAHLPDYMLPSYFVELESLPLNANGKVNRKALPSPEIKAGDDYVAPSNEIEEKLVEIWSEVLNLASKEISTNLSFFELGGHSLKAVILKSYLTKHFNIEINLDEIFKYPCIKEFSKLIEAKERTEYVEIENVEKKEYYDVTSNQARLWFLNKLDDKSTAFNLVDIFSLGLTPNYENIISAIKELLYVNESLRTGFRTVKGKPVQFICDINRIDVEQVIYDLRNENDLNKRLIEFKNYEFDLSKPPLVKFIIFRTDDGNIAVGFVIHHTISDGWSMGILKKEFEKYYIKEEVNLKKRFSYIDYTNWLKQFVNSKKEQSREFWMQLLNSPIESGGLPKDFDNITNKKSGSILLKYLNKDQNSRIQTLSKNLNTSSFTIMFTAYLYLLKKITGSKRPSCFIINAGRNHYSTFSMVGFFVNAVLFNTEIDEDLSFENFIENLHNQTTQAFDYQHFPVEELFEEMRMKYPEIPVAFNMLNMNKKVSGDGLIKNEKRANLLKEVKFDIELYVQEFEQEVELSFVYNKNIFQEETIQFIANTYVEMLNYILEKSDESYKDYLKSKKKLKLF